MGLKIYNSLTRTKEEFVPANRDKVLMYVCGPTVYSFIHIGNARSAVAFDVIFRYLKYKGYNVVYARNYTDVDDKIINRAKEDGKTAEEVAELYTKEFDADMAALGIETPTHRPKATETIPAIIEMIAALVEKGFAYVSGADVFYSVRRMEGYGALSGKDINELASGARVDVNEAKNDPLDFALWKGSKPDEPFWDSPWGKGRPGWHIECSAMCRQWLGETIDIHGGGRDLIFPHHENEIAQSEAATGISPFVRYWLHNGFVNIEKDKMSKSLGNILNLRDLLAEYPAEAIRLFLLSSHYRSPIDYTKDSLKESVAALDRFYKTAQRIETEFPDSLGLDYCVDCNPERFSPLVEAMDDDFNTAELVGLIFKEVTRGNKIMDEAAATGGKDGAIELAFIRAEFKEAGKMLGVFNRGASEYFAEKRLSIGAVDKDAVERLIKARDEARRNKDFAKADAVRGELASMGIVLEDTARGTVWSVGR